MTASPASPPPHGKKPTGRVVSKNPTAAQEQLRQEREAFDLAKSQSERWFVLRLRMGYVTLGAVAGLAIGLVGLMAFAHDLPPGILPWAFPTVGGAVISGLLAGWRQILNSGAAPTVTPLTKSTARPAKQKRKPAPKPKGSTDTKPPGSTVRPSGRKQPTRRST